MFEAAIPFPNFDPVLIHIWGPFGIRWYALSYIAGLLLGWWYVVRLIRDKTLWTAPLFAGKPPLTVDDVGDFVVWATLGVIVGGRLGWVLFYGTFLCSVSPDAGYCHGLPGAFLTDPIRIVAAWEGGMSFHGGLIGVITALWLFTRRRRIDFVRFGDLVACAAPIGLFFGRIANFINGELWGKVTDVPWAMVFCSQAHPCDLWRTLSGRIRAAASEPALRSGHGRASAVPHHARMPCACSACTNGPGLLGAIFLTGYGTFRFIAEIFREPDTPFIGWFSLGMAFSIPMWLGAIYLYWYALRPKTAQS